MKTNKSYSKRLRVTKKGKLVARHAGQDHFNAKESRKTRSRKQRASEVSMNRIARSRFLANS